MKKLLLLALVVIMCVVPVLVACDNNNNPPATTPAGTSAPQSTEPATTTPATTKELITSDVPVASGDFSYTLVESQATIVGYTGKGGDLVIPEKIDDYPVVAIKSFLFNYNDTLTSVTIPGSVKETGDLAFFACKNIKKVTLGEGVEKVSRSCFNYCEALETVVKPSSLKVIDEIAFQGCTALKSFDLSGITTIGYRAFAGSGLTTVTIPASVTSMGESAFLDCEAMTTAVFAASVEDLPNATFSMCFGLKSIDIQAKIKRVKNSAFYRCTSLEALVLPDSCFKIEQHALFGVTSMKTVTILNKTDKFYLDYYAGEFMPALETVNYAGSEAQRAEWDVGNYNTHFTAAAMVYNYN